MQVETHPSTDWIYPFCTRPFDLRTTGDLRPMWKEKIMTNISENEILNANVVILFEILDWNFHEPNRCNHENLIPIAWA